MSDNKDKVLYDLYMKKNALILNLKGTDYLAIKYAEGALTFAEFADTMKQRQEWRAEINALETEIKMIRGN